MATVDSLDIQISASAQSASKSIDNLVGKLNTLSKALKIDTSGLEKIGKLNIGSGLQDIGSQTKKVSENFSEIAKQSKDMGKTVSSSMASAAKPMKEAQKSASEIAKELKENLKGIDVKIDFSKPEEELKKFQRQAQNAQNALTRILASSTADKQTKGIEKWTIALAQANNAIEQLQSKVQKPITFQGDLSAMSEAEINEWFKTLPSQQQKIEEISNAIAEASQRVSEYTAKWNGIEIPEFLKKIDTSGIEKSTDTIREKIQEISDRFKESGKDLVFEGNTEQLEKQIQQVSGELDKLYNKQDRMIELGQIDTSSFTGLIRDIENAQNRLEILENYRPEALNRTLEENAEKAKTAAERLKELGANLGKLEVPPIREENLDKLTSALEKTEAKLEELRTNLVNGLTMGRITKSVDDSGFVKLQEQITLTEKTAEALRQKISEVSGNEPKWNFSKISSGAKTLQKSLQPLYNTLKKVSNAASNFAKKILSIVLPFKKVKNQANGFHGSLSGGLKTILKYGIGIRSLYTLFNKLRNAINEGMKNLVQYSNETNASISLLNNSLNQFKNASAAAIAPVLNAIAPALNTIIQLFIRATNAINQFFAALAGNGTWIRAKELTDDYADSISNAAKEAKNGIRSFDELNVITTQDTSGSGTGTSAADMFETLPIESKFQELADKIKSVMEQIFEPLKTAWESQGQNVMDSWKYALEEIRLLAKSIGSDFLEVWNQTETLEIFENILEIVSDIGKTAGNLAHNFREAWEENETGLHILENIRDIFAVIIANIKAAADYTVDWSANLNFTPLLEAFERFTASLVPAVDAISGVLADFYTMVLLPLGKWTLEKGLPELLDVFTDFNDAVDWESLKSNLAEFWEHLEPFAETVGEGLIIFIDRVSDSVANFLNSETFVNFLHDLEDWMDSVEPEDVADGIAKLAEAFVTLKVALLGLNVATKASTVVIGLSKIAKVFKVLKLALVDSVSFIKGINWVYLFQTINPGIIGELGLSLERLLQGTFLDTNTWKGLPKKIDDAIMNTLNNLANSLGAAFKQFFKDVFNFDATQELFKLAKEDFEEGGVYILRGILDGFIGALSLITEPISDFFEATWKAICDVFGIHSPAENMKPIGKYLLLGIIEGFTSKISDFSTAIQNWYEESVVPWFTAEKWQQLGENAKEGISEKWREFTDWWASTGLYNWWNESVAPWFTLEKWTKLADSIKTGISERWNETAYEWKENIENWWNESVAPWFTLEKWTNIMSNVKEAFSKTFKNAANAAIEIFNKLIGWINEKMHFEWDAITIAGVEVAPAGNVQLFTIPQIPKFGTGAIVYRPTYAEIGEAGKEGILPLTNRAAMSQLVDEIVASAGTTSSGVLGNSIDTEKTIYNAVYNAVSAAVKNNSNNDNTTIQINLDGDVVYKNMIKRTQLKKSNVGGRFALAEEIY